MERLGNSRSSGKEGTPDPQRFQVRTLGCHPDPPHVKRMIAPTIAIDGTRERQEMHTDNASDPLRSRDCAAISDLHTPPTVSRLSWLQLHAHDLQTPSTVSERVLSRAAATSAVPSAPSPCSSAPPVLTDAPLTRRARSHSCSSANRSVAPARTSAGVLLGPPMDSAGRHTTMLFSGGGAGFQHPFQGTPIAGSHAAASTALFGRPTVLLHASPPVPVRRDSGSDVTSVTRRSRACGELPSHAFAAGAVLKEGFYADPHVFFEDGDGTVRQRGTSVPRLTRFSGESSSNACSPGINSMIGRPTTMQFPGFDADSAIGWEVEGESEGTSERGRDDEDGMWLGGNTQVWRNSAELQDPTVPANCHARQQSSNVHCSASTERGRNEEEEDVVVAPRAAHRGTATQRATQQRDVFVSPSPQRTGNARPSPSFDHHEGGTRLFAASVALSPSYQLGTTDEGGSAGGMPNVIPNASFHELEAAPRKSYLRSNTHTPPPEPNGGGPHAVAGEWGERATASTASSEAPPFAASTQPNTSFCAYSAPARWEACEVPRTCPFHGSATDDGVPMPPTQQSHPPGGWSHGHAADMPTQAVGAQTPRGPSTVLPPSNVQRACMATPNHADSAAAAAVAVQLARLSLQASPTQKRLAFEEDDDVVEGGHNSGSIVGEEESAYGRTRAATWAKSSQSTAGSSECRARNTAGARRGAVASTPGKYKSGTGNAAVGAPRRGGNTTSSAQATCASGLQLLRSRKRCLAEMRASDPAELAPITPIISTGIKDADPPEGGTATLFSSCDGGLAPPPPSPEDLKRQKRELQRTHRRQHLLPSGYQASSDDLIPAPQRYTFTPGCPAYHSAFPPASSQSQVFSRRATPASEDAPWSQLSSISYVTPASQSTSLGLWGMQTYASMSSQDAGSVASAPHAQVLATLPVNVPSRSSPSKQ